MRVTLRLIAVAGLIAEIAHGRALPEQAFSRRALFNPIEVLLPNSREDTSQTRNPIVPFPDINQVLFDETSVDSPSQEQSDGLENTPMDSQQGPAHILHYRNINGGQRVQDGKKLRILTVGDSITVGFLSDQDGGDGSGYRGELRNDLFRNDVVFAGTEYMASILKNNYFAAWSGKTIQYISDNVGASLEQRPNLVLLSAGTNDMNSNSYISTEGNDPKEAAERLGSLIDKIHRACPDAVILVSMIANVCDNTEYHDQHERTKRFQRHIADVVKVRYERRQPVLAADFSPFGTGDILRDCVHPTNRGYQIMGDWWYGFITQIPRGWVPEARGSDPH